MEPPPVGVDSDGTADRGATATGSALRPLKSGMGLSGEGAYLLGPDGGHEGSGQDGELGIHGPGV